MIIYKQLRTKECSCWNFLKFFVLYINFFF